MPEDNTTDIHEAGLSLDLTDLMFETRIGANLSQAQVAEALGTSESEVAAWESGDKVPTVDVLAKLAKLCGKRLHISIDVD